MIELEKKYIDEIVAHARQDDPDECCGILLSKDRRVVALRRVTNAEHSPYRIPNNHWPYCPNSNT